MPHASPVPASPAGDQPESPAAITERLPVEFFRRVWAPPHDLDAIDALMTEDYTITTGGVAIRGRAAFKRWVGDLQRRMPDATNETLEVFANAERQLPCQPDGRT